MGSLSVKKVLLNHWSYNLFCTKCPLYNNSIIQRFPKPLASSSSSVIYNCAYRQFSSKTPSNSSLAPAVASTADNESHIEKISSETLKVPYFSGYDIRELDPETKIKIHSASVEVAKAQAASLVANKRRRRRKEILIMDEEEYKDKVILAKKGPLLDRRGEAQSFFLRSMAPDDFNSTDILCTVQADIDLRPVAIKKWLARRKEQNQIALQSYIPRRHQILGNELAAAHVVVARGGKVKFMGQNIWVTDYRKDAKPGVPEEDLPVMKLELCTLPVNYDPRFRLEAIDASGVELYYEGLENFENLNYVKWLSLRNCPHIDDWCLDRISRIFNETLEYIDVSGCKKLTDKGIGTLHRCSNLKVIVAEDMGHLENIEIVSALLEDYNPNIEVIGIDYQAKTEQLRLEAEELEMRANEIEANNQVIHSLPEPVVSEDKTVKTKSKIESATT